MKIDSEMVAAAAAILRRLMSNKKFVTQQLLDYEVAMRVVRTAFNELPDKLEAGNDEEFETLLSRAGWYGPLTALLNMKGISAIMINAPDKAILVDRGGEVKRYPPVRMSTDWIRCVVRLFRQARGLSLDLPDRYTGSLTDPPVRYTYVSSRLGVSGDSMYIRVLPRNPMTWQDLIDSGMMNREVARFLRAMVKIRVNILVSGGSGAGKTTLLTTMGTAIPRDERVIAVEDEHEVHLVEVLPNFTAYELNPEIPNITMSDLLRNVGLKVAPDRVFVGEIRGKEAFDLMQAMNTGIDGSMATIHANSPVDALKKMADYVAMSDVPMPPEVIYSRIADSKLFVVQVMRLPNGRRVVSGIAECRSVTKTMFEVGTLFRLGENGVAVRNASTPFSPYLAERLARYNIVLGTGPLQPQKAQKVRA